MGDKKEKKAKRARPEVEAVEEKQSERPVAEQSSPAEIDEAQAEAERPKRKRVRKKKETEGQEDIEETVGVAEEQAVAALSEPEPEPTKRIRSRSAKKRTNEQEAPPSNSVISTESQAEENHAKSLSKALPTRAERARRENQRKMQQFVASLRDQGYSAKDIEKMKKKAKSKMKFIAADVPFGDVVSDMSDMHITCRDCGNDFVFSVKDQVFYNEKGFPPAVRCRECSAAKKERMSKYDNKRY